MVAEESEQVVSIPADQVVLRVPESMREGVYANFVRVSHGEHEFYLDFALLPEANGAWATLNTALQAHLELVRDVVSRGTRPIVP